MLLTMVLEPGFHPLFPCVLDKLSDEGLYEAIEGANDCAKPAPNVAFGADPLAVSYTSASDVSRV